MSINIQRSLLKRSQFGANRPTFEEQVYSDGFTISQLTLVKSLPGHTGCVNTLDWSLGGDKLLSGSDDTKLNIYLPFENYEIAHVIDTGHRANIFTAKFMPQTSESVIISGAGDSEIRIFDLHNTENPLFAMYVCHSDQVKKICIYDDNPNEFLACSQDGTVRHFDIRVPHICSPHTVKSFLTAQSKPAKQYPLPSGNNLQSGCSKPIVDYSKYNIELNSMTVNKLFTQYFAVAGMNDYIYLHDRRMMQNTTSPLDKYNNVQYVKRFSPRSDGRNRPNKHITSCKFSDYNGYELIGSWSSDAIYLFNINDSFVESKLSSTNSTTNERSVPSNHAYNNIETTSTTATANSEEEESTNVLWERITSNFTRHNLSNALSYNQRFLRSLETLDDIDANVGKCCGCMIGASILSAYQNLGPIRGIESLIVETANEEQIRDLIEKGESYAPRIWYGVWCKAIGYWLLGGGSLSNGSQSRESYLRLSLGYAINTRSLLQEQMDNHVSSPSSFSVLDGQPAFIDVDMGQVYMNMINKFITDLNIVFILEHYVENTNNIVIPNIQSTESENRRYDWINFMCIPQLPFSVSELATLVSMAGLRSASSTLERRISENNTNNVIEETLSISTTTTPEEQDQEDEFSLDEDDQSLVRRVMSRQILDVYRNEDDGFSEDEDLDWETLAIFRGIENQSSINTDISITEPRSKYTGHCNIETVKDVEFFGLRDEYILSGSDKGHLFIWEKKTSKIVQILRADGEVVNVAKGHPFLPLIAVSGIDSTVKIFEPTSRLPSSSKIIEPHNPQSYSSSSRLYKQEEIIEANRESNDSLEDEIYITRSMYAAFLRLERQRRQFVTNGFIDNSDTDEEEEED